MRISTIVFMFFSLIVPIFHPASLHALGLVETHETNIQSKTYELNVFNKFIGFWSFVGRSDLPEVRGMSWEVPEKGWAHFADTYVQAVQDAGWRRGWLHNPFGRTPGELMEFCQYLEAQRHQPPEMASLMTENFSNVFRTVKQNGFEVVMYVGGAHQDDELVPLENDPNAWWDHVFKCLEPYIDSDMSVLGIDNSGPRLLGTPSQLVADWWVNNRGPVVVEARPRVNTPHWFDGFPVMAIAGTWDLQAPERNENQIGRHAYEWEFNGEVIELVHWEDEDLVNWTLTKDALREGHTVLSPASNIIGPRHANFKDLDEYIRHLGVDIGHRIDFFSTAPKADSGLEFIIEEGPYFGTLEPMWFDPTGSVFIYTPSLYFTGTDVIRFRTQQGDTVHPSKVITMNVSGLSSDQSRNLSVSAGENQNTFPGFQLLLEGNVAHATRPLSEVKTLWAKVSGPGDIIFSAPTLKTTSAFATVPGDYVIRLTASDGDVSQYDDLTVTIHSAGSNISVPQNTIQIVQNVIQSGRSDEAVFHLHLNQPLSASVNIFDRNGRKVVPLLKKELDPGTQVISWNGRTPEGVAVASGIYMLLIELGDKELTEKVVVIR